MILIADSGSTKTEWTILNTKTNHSQQHTTQGINPYYQDIKTIKDLLNKEFPTESRSFDSIYFYGAGCNHKTKNKIVESALSSVFISPHINVHSDLMAAAHSACGHSQGVVCILGTGSNSCFYDGNEITQNVSPLGFIIGDEGSGASIGKTFIADLLKNQLSQSTKELFFKEYNITEAEILDHIYKQPFPNRYLAQFTKFINKHIDIKELENIINQTFTAFIERNLLQYNEIEKYSIHFTGSIAYYFKEQLENALNSHQLKLGTITKSPMSGLIEYYS
ncbi:BadF/BadG/BcrA/BcrD ATPase family protein [Plebeiibacterium sediminum]|uniref:ATPase n=1 Tax=Plebeiibacterium sediminum TaxID=2992112 RepID=A0AAE3M3F7_9BACT|nr:BadF/BadG/BcrA/BcrD ATPase family protein [Plebeiobacterium sediminum]MCW3786472.1 ATPase [Plebeiobacterium sediminum]